MIGLLMLVASLVPSPARNFPVETRHDLTCVEAVSWADSLMKGQNSEARHNVEEVGVFYIGRLSGRDNDTDWLSIAATDLRDSRRSEADYASELKDCSDRMYEKITPKP